MTVEKQMLLYHKFSPVLTSQKLMMHYTGLKICWILLVMAQLLGNMRMFEVYS